jgi:hypothetical protein
MNSSAAICDRELFCELVGKGLCFAERQMERGYRGGEAESTAISHALP